MLACINFREHPAREDTEKMRRVACHHGPCEGKGKDCVNPGHIRMKSKRADALQRDTFQACKRQKSDSARNPTSFSNVIPCPSQHSHASDACSLNQKRAPKQVKRAVYKERGLPKSQTHKIRDQDFFSTKNAAVGCSLRDILHSIQEKNDEPMQWTMARFEEEAKQYGDARVARDAPDPAYPTSLVPGGGRPQVPKTHSPAIMGPSTLGPIPPPSKRTKEKVIMRETKPKLAYSEHM
jgi:hypothetical protein